MEKNLITGVVVSGAALEWATLRQRKGQVEVVGRGQGAVDLPEGPLDFASPAAGPALRKAGSGIRGRVCFAVPTDQVLLRVAELPSSDPTELAGMVDLQVDKFSPFPIEHMQVSHETLARQEGSTRVLILALRREIVNGIGGALGKAGLLPRWIDAEILGWWHLLLEGGAVLTAGRHLILVAHGRGVEIVAAQDGVPVLFRTLGGPSSSAEEFAAELAEEVGYTLTSLEAEWGAAAETHVSLWVREQPPPELAERLAAESGAEVRVHLLDELPPLCEGLARRSVGRDGDKANLAPPAWRERESSRRALRVFVAATAAFLVIWLAGLAAFAGGLNLRKKDLQGLRERARDLDARAEEVLQLQEKVGSLERYADRAHSSLECLREVTSLLPAGVDLTAFVYKKGKTLSLRGEAQRAEPIYDFFGALEKSELFTTVKPEGVQDRMRGGARKSEFSVTIGLPGGAQ